MLIDSLAVFTIASLDEIMVIASIRSPAALKLSFILLLVEIENWCR
jgi:hypothetical protein